MASTTTSGNGFAAVAAQSKLNTLETAPKAVVTVRKQIAGGELAPPTTAKRTVRIAKAIVAAEQAPAKLGKQRMALATKTASDLAQAHAKRYGTKLAKAALIPPAGNGSFGVYRARGLQAPTPALLQVLGAMLALKATGIASAVSSSAIVAQAQCTPRNARHYNYLGQAMGLTVVLCGGLGYTYHLTPAGAKLAAEHAPKAKAKAQGRKPKAKASKPNIAPVPAS